ncbi:hypothetical protein PC121_g5551 [Phytophthora cactorum]|nr:hypothetical protein PC120_g8379 [Phytophthora cactorum]KAG3083950.1 hypothetical protein PC121_g5551 [Phytophthora cactorum]
MKGRERWSLLDGSVLGRRRSAQVAVDQFLDRLVDIFDFPLAPPSYNTGSPPTVPTSRKHSTSTAVDAYTTMDGSISPRSRSRECTIGASKKPRKVSVADRVRELLLHSSRSKSMTRNSVAICNNTMKSNNTSNARELRMSWLSEKRRTDPVEPKDDLWVERDEQDRQLECGYQCLADEATI